VADIAQKLGLKLVTFHAGFLPHKEGDPRFGTLLQRIGMIADLFAGKGIDLGFETGQETAETLGAFLQKLDRRNAGVNFDPANMILYDKGDPIAALQTLGPWLKQCHVKDAVKTKIPGAFGREVPVGAGEVDWRAFLRTLDKLHFGGNLAIEREAGEQRADDIRAARKHLETIVY
jgi:sugar phosphate isomerase/epimerase